MECAASAGHRAPMNSGGLHNCLTRLIPHVDAARIALTGGVAIGMHIASIYGDVTRAAAAEQTSTSVRRECHRHPANGDERVSRLAFPSAAVRLSEVSGYNWSSPVTRLRSDFFPGDVRQALGRALDCRCSRCSSSDAWGGR